jgi:hypothetical protein
MGSTARCWGGVPLGMHRLNPERLGPDLTAATDLLLREEPDEEEDEEKDNEEEDDDAGDEDY